MRSAERRRALQRLSPAPAAHLGGALTLVVEEAAHEPARVTVGHGHRRFGLEGFAGQAGPQSRFRQWSHRGPGSNLPGLAIP